jgi:hypothetical protein
MKDTWALTTRQPSGIRTQVCVWRPRLPDSSRWNFVLAVARLNCRTIVSRASASQADEASYSFRKASGESPQR